MVDKEQNTDINLATPKEIYDELKRIEVRKEELYLQLYAYDVEDIMKEYVKTVDIIKGVNGVRIENYLSGDGYYTPKVVYLVKENGSVINIEDLQKYDRRLLHELSQFFMQSAEDFSKTEVVELRFNELK